MKQRPHLRKSKRGRVFRAGRGLPRKNFGSQMLRQRIRKDLKMEDPLKEKVVRIMEKDPLLYQDYRDTGKPEVIIDPTLFDETSLLGQKTSKRDLKDVLLLKWPKLKHEVKLDPIIFKEGLSSYRKHLGTRTSASPRFVIDHELAHIKYDKLFKRRPELIFHNIDEQLADYRANFDIRKVNVPKSDEERKNRILFRRFKEWEK